MGLVFLGMGFIQAVAFLMNSLWACRLSLVAYLPATLSTSFTSALSNWSALANFLSKQSSKLISQVLSLK